MPGFLSFQVSISFSKVLILFKHETRLASSLCTLLLLLSCIGGRHELLGSCHSCCSTENSELLESHLIGQLLITNDLLFVVQELSLESWVRENDTSFLFKDGHGLEHVIAELLHEVSAYYSRTS